MKFLLVENLEDLQSSLEYFSTKKYLGLDIETESLEPWDGNIVLIQVSDGDKTSVINVKKLIKRWGKDKIVSLLKLFLENPDIEFIIHNSKFERKWLTYHFGIILVKVFDTFIASQLIEYEIKGQQRIHNLNSVGKRFLGIDLDKTEQKSDWGRETLTPEQLEYAALDVIYLPDLREVMWAALDADKLLYTAKIDFECVQCVVEAEIRGLNVNREKYEKEIVTLEKLRETASATLQDTLRPTTGIDLIQKSFFDLPEKDYGEVLLTSHAQMLTALQKLGVPCIAASQVDEIAKAEKRGDMFAIGTGEKALAPIAHLYPVAKLLNDFRGVDKMTTGFGRKFLAKLIPAENGTERVHPSFFINGASTGRMSAKDPNSMQIPNGEVEVGVDTYPLAFRNAFDFPVGRVGVIADYSQIELRIAGEFSQDPVFLKAFNTGLDLHALTAATIFDLDYDDCANDKHDHYHKYRAFAKRVNFGIVYGIGAFGLSALLKNSVEECKEILAKHRSGHPVLWSYLDSQKNKAKRILKARTASGRTIRFNEPDRDSFGEPDKGQLAAIARIGTNQPIQGTSADILKIALKLINDRMRHLDADVVNMVHDEIMVECAEECAQEVREILETSMREAGEIFIKTVKIKVDAKIIKTWADK